MRAANVLPTTLGMGLGVVLAACFTAPARDVQFSCDVVTAPACPPDYTCQTDGCCHKDSSDPGDKRGACHGFDSGTGAGTADTGITTAGPSTSGPGTGAGSGGAATGSTSDTGATGDTGADTGTTGAAT